MVEDSLGYGEPPLWLQPVRHTLGAVYLKSGRYGDVERVYREDLHQWRDNGWSLYGLSRALEGQGKLEEAQVIRRDFDRVWTNADEPSNTSCRCIPEIWVDERDWGRQASDVRLAQPRARLPAGRGRVLEQQAREQLDSSQDPERLLGVHGRLGRHLGSSGGRAGQPSC